MNRRHFLVLLFVSVLLAGLIALLVPGGAQHEEIRGDLFLKGIGARINEVSGVFVTGRPGTHKSSLIKGDSGWTIDELDGYPADWDHLKTLLASLAEARVVEPKTSNPEYYSILGVEDPGQQGSNSVLLEISLGGEGSNEVLGIIIGNQTRSRQGQYVRLANSEQSVLIDQALTIDAQPMSWADDGIIDIGSSLVAEISISHPDGDRITARKVSADDADFKLSGLPPGREIRSSWSVNSLATVFSLLSMDAVKPDPGEDFHDPVTITVMTFSGLMITAVVVEKEGRGWIRLSAKAAEVSDSAGDDEMLIGAVHDLSDRAEKINQKVHGWMYRLPDSNFDAMTKRLEQLLKPLDEGDEA